MKFIADESVDLPVVERLRGDGHNVHYVAEMAAGISDEEVSAAASNSKALLLTADKDFGESVYRLHRISEGIVLMRLAGLTPGNKASLSPQLSISMVSGSSTHSRL